MSQLSVIIITKNEAENIERCLQSVCWANEIIVVDSGSTDDTQSICERYGVKFYSDDWQGYGIQKNRALNKANGDWVLSLDADEYLSDGLQTEIQQAIKSPQFDGYQLLMRLVFNDRIIKHAVGLNKHLRLFRRDKAQFTNDEVHEVVNLDGRIGQLQSVIYHRSFANVERLLEKMNHYSTISADMKHKSGKKGNAWRATFGALWIFFRLYVLNRGFLDGKEGLVLAVSFAEGSFYRYIKLSYL